MADAHYLDPIPALQHLAVLIDAAIEADDIELVRKHLAGMKVIIDRSLPRKYRAEAPGAEALRKWNASQASGSV